MKLAFLIQCHKNPEQINLLLTQLDHSDVVFFVHVDQKSDISNKILSRPNIHLLPDELRVDVRWGEFSQVSAAINLLFYASRHGEFDYYWQISGQDFPIQPIHKILDFLLSNNGCNFINVCSSKYNRLGHSNNFDKRAEIYYPAWMAKRKFLIRTLRRIYIAVTGGFLHTFKIFKRKAFEKIKPCFGSCWWCLHSDFVHYAIEYIEKYPTYPLFFKNVLCSDEAFFQTLFMNSPYSKSQREYLHYIDWSRGDSSPKNLCVSDFEAIINSPKFIARKIDGDYDLISLLSEHIAKTLHIKEAQDK